MGSDLRLRGVGSEIGLGVVVRLVRPVLCPLGIDARWARIDRLPILVRGRWFLGIHLVSSSVAQPLPVPAASTPLSQIDRLSSERQSARSESHPRSLLRCKLIRKVASWEVARSAHRCTTEE
jgi:hypothetical protein